VKNKLKDGDAINRRRLEATVAAAKLGVTPPYPELLPLR
jgi:hypothetical protein